MTREALAASGVAAILSAVLVWVGPPSGDFAAHAYQRALFIQHGFEFWNNFWYAGRYSFVTYSLLYYPLAAVVGIRLLAVVTVAIATLAFTIVVLRQWGSSARWSARAFAVVWAGIVLRATFPFALGSALALLAMLALQRRRLWSFAALAVLTLAASPVAFLMLAVILVGIAVGRRTDRRLLICAGLAIGTLGLVEIVLWRVFPDDGHLPFSGWDLAAALVFCSLGTVLSWDDERTRILRFLFPVYGIACILTFVIPSAIGGDNVIRLRYAAIPVAVLILALRNWRPRLLGAVAMTLAILWNVTPLVESFASAANDPAARAAFWAPAIQYLHRHLTPSYRVEAVDTSGHWPAYYLAQSDIPLARGWYRQDDFPQNALLYGHLGPRAYLAWLRGLGVRYVVLANAPPDYSSEAERRLLESGRLPLRIVLVSPTLTIYEVPSPRPIVTGPGPSRVMTLREDNMSLRVARPGTYRVAIRYSPYWHSSVGCVSPGKDRMIRLKMPRAGLARMTFDVDASGVLTEMAGGRPKPCS